MSVEQIVLGPERGESRTDGGEGTPEAPDSPAVLVVALQDARAGPPRGNGADETADALRTLGFTVTETTADAAAGPGTGPTAADAEPLGERLEDGAFDCVVAHADASSAPGSPGPLDASAFDTLGRLPADAPVVLVGGDAADAADAFEAGAAEFVPAANAADPAVLDARVRSAVARSEAARLRSERERLAADLSRERGLLNAIFETVPAHLYVKDREAKHIRVSEAYVGDPDRFLGKTDYDVVPDETSRGTYEDDLRIMETGQPLFDQEEPIVPADTTFSMQSLLERHGEADGTVTGDWVLTSKVPWRDADGEVVGLVGFSIDISDRKADRRRLERQNERLSEFADVVSHDLRSPLNVAQGYLELLGEAVDDETARSYLHRIEDAHGRMDELIEDVLALARQGTVVDDLTSTRIADVVDAAWRSTTTHGATLAVETGDATVPADPGRLRALFENLFRNAVEHGARQASGRSAPGDSVEHSSTNSRATPDDSVEHGSTDDDTHTLTVTVGRTDGGFYVEDDGPGISESERETVFEAGHSSVADGTGFGLAIVKRIAEAHGWSVTLTESETGGARFEFAAEHPAGAVDGSV
ncbi:PAS domain-containing sensor histidine kinase [Halogeometricum sp. S1BR25-6]|uniref:histidine kinase n=1 Tax=Halogeometricum salsisoli TaxID=2950536 RepID=A0ABU2GFH5_9EURY|nr:PAS domain-containing sensor histidine kinase [Halogeometricum sp. S1BR25-6]MDS0299557.1 PAS domain-containing sensor histidine kinase [Halogeometricum sp. S1BR25-6]